MSTPEFASEAEAVAAFGKTFEDPPVEQAVAEPVVEAPEAEVTTSEEDSFKGFDPTLLSTLSPEIQAAVKAQQASMQGDYTRKTQEAAELRKQFEGLDPELARQSVSYIQQLSDPEFLQQAHSAMSAELERLGFSPKEAAAKATEQIAEQEYEDEDDGVTSRFQSELDELKAWKTQTQQEQYQTYLTNEVLKQETVIRQTNPTYTDQDIGHIMELAWSTNGNLLNANKAYQNMRNYFAKDLLAQKASTTGAIAPSATGEGSTLEAPPKFASLEEAHKAAMERMRVLSANE